MTIAADRRSMRILNDDTREALERLDADLCAIEVATSPRAVDALDMLHHLRRRAVAAYRDALAYAAGSPDDGRWTLLALTVAAFLARIPEGVRASGAAAAVVRLRALVAENAEAL